MAHEVAPRPVEVPAGPVALEGDLRLPAGARGIVLFAHGSGSSRHSPRNRRVAALLDEARLATLLVDLLTRDEETIDGQTAALRFDIDRLARRLVGITDWLMQHRDTRLNQQAAAQLRCEKRLVIVPGATHLFEEPGTLDEVARLARDRFERHLGRCGG
jgi:hypothetical protein